MPRYKKAGEYQCVGCGVVWRSRQPESFCCSACRLGKGHTNSCYRRRLREPVRIRSRSPTRRRDRDRSEPVRAVRDRDRSEPVGAICDREWGSSARASGDRWTDNDDWETCTTRDRSRSARGRSEEQGHGPIMPIRRRARSRGRSRDDSRSRLQWRSVAPSRRVVARTAATVSSSQTDGGETTSAAR